ncbi:MAG: DUF4412 domain-containing protein [Deltaproteobacteria bacterium]|jgi:hypothetical protein
MMRIIRLGMTLFFLFSYTTLSLAGVVVKNKNGSVAYFSSGKVKNVSPDNDVSTIFDVKDNLVTVINQNEKSYTTATVEQFSKAAQAMRDEAMAQMPPEQRTMMEQFMIQQKNKKAPKVTIKNLGSGGEIAGYPTSKYLVLADGKKYAEIYLSDKKLPMYQEMNLDQLWDFGEKFRKSTVSSLGMGGLKTVETDPAYRQLMRRGYPLKKVSYENGKPKISQQVVSVEKKSLPASEFRAPAGYKKLEVKAFFEQKK